MMMLPTVRLLGQTVGLVDCLLEMRVSWMFWAESLPLSSRSCAVESEAGLWALKRFLSLIMEACL